MNYKKTSISVVFRRIGCANAGGAKGRRVFSLPYPLLMVSCTYHATPDFSKS